MAFKGFIIAAVSLNENYEEIHVGEFTVSPEDGMYVQSRCGSTVSTFIFKFITYLLPTSLASGWGGARVPSPVLHSLSTVHISESCQMFFLPPPITSLRFEFRTGEWVSCPAGFVHNAQKQIWLDACPVPPITFIEF